ncbi:hypothetical protein C8R44DRAFT_546823, partial [Mycena epipterygia]
GLTAESDILPGSRDKTNKQQFSATTGLCVVRVRVIFCIPEDFGPYPEPLAYVDWFKPLQQPLVDLGMHQVSLSSRHHR